MIYMLKVRMGFSRSEIRHLTLPEVEAFAWVMKQEQEANDQAHRREQAMQQFERG